MRNSIKVFALCLLMLPMFSVEAQSEQYVEGIHYTTLKDVTYSSSGNPEVVEVFWYGCGHCYAFEPLLDNWKMNIAATVDFVRSPVTWNKTSIQHAQLYFVAEALGVTEKVHGEIFDAIHQSGNYLLNEQDAKEFFVAFGVNGDEFDRSYKSFGVNSALKKAESMQKNVGISSVPSMIVNQQYIVTMNTAINAQEALKVVDYLLAKDAD